MIKTEFLNNGTLIKHFSDAGFMLLQVETGIKYSEPVDVVPCRYTYEETDELIDEESEIVNTDEAMIDVFTECVDELINDDNKK